MLDQNLVLCSKNYSLVDTLCLHANSTGLGFFFVDGMFFGNPTEGDLGNHFNIILRTCSEPVIGCFFIQAEVALKQALQMPIKKEAWE